MRVRLYSPAPSTAQSGHTSHRPWVIEPECVSPRLPESIMGWLSAEDGYGSLKGRLRFESEEAAMAFVRGKKWEINASEEPSRTIRPKSYLDNFRILRPEDEEKLTLE